LFAPCDGSESIWALFKDWQYCFGSCSDFCPFAFANVGSANCAFTNFGVRTGYFGRMNGRGASLGSDSSLNLQWSSVVDSTGCSVFAFAIFGSANFGFATANFGFATANFGFATANFGVTNG
jgi:hypothetical protein